jgi:hypothetical protein
MFIVTLAVHCMTKPGGISEQLIVIGVVTVMQIFPFTVKQLVGTVAALKIAATFLAEFINTVQEPAPVQSPLHPANDEPEPGTALSVTELFVPKLFVQADPQLIPAGEEIIVPLPEPALVTVNKELPVGVPDATAEAGLSPYPFEATTMT